MESVWQEILSPYMANCVQTTCNCALFWNILLTLIFHAAFDFGGLRQKAHYINSYWLNYLLVFRKCHFISCSIISYSTKRTISLLFDSFHYLFFCLDPKFSITANHAGGFSWLKWQTTREWKLFTFGERGCIDGWLVKYNSSLALLKEKQKHIIPTKKHNY